MQYINIHTHKSLNNKYTVRNLFPEDLNLINNTEYFSAGLHPREVAGADIEKSLNIIKKVALKVNVLAVGEIGLDKYKDAFDLQTEVFLKQIDIASAHNKPIVIHCVKAYSELLSILKEKKLSVPIIIHRYSGNKTIADQLIKFGCYLSFGHELFNEKSKVQRVFKSIPDQHIFLETDDSEIVIEDIYQKASELRKTDILDLQKIIIANFEACFKIKIDS